MDKIEARSVIKFLSLKGLGNDAIFQEMQTVYGDSGPPLRTIQRWASEFRRGRTSLDDEPRSGRPRTSTGPDQIHAVEQMVKADRRVRVQQIAQELGISVGSVTEILHEKLFRNKVSARWVPHMLSVDDLAERERESNLQLTSWKCTIATLLILKNSS